MREKRRKRKTQEERNRVELETLSIEIYGSPDGYLRPPHTDPTLHVRRFPSETRNTSNPVAQPARSARSDGRSDPFQPPSGVAAAPGSRYTAHSTPARAGPYDIPNYVQATDAQDGSVDPRRQQTVRSRVINNNPEFDAEIQTMSSEWRKPVGMFSSGLTALQSRTQRSNPERPYTEAGPDFYAGAVASYKPYRNPYWLGSAYVSMRDTVYGRTTIRKTEAEDSQALMNVLLYDEVLPMTFHDFVHKCTGSKAGSSDVATFHSVMPHYAFFRASSLGHLSLNWFLLTHVVGDTPAITAIYDQLEAYHVHRTSHPEQSSLPYIWELILYFDVSDNVKKMNIHDAYKKWCIEGQLFLLMWIVIFEGLEFEAARSRFTTYFKKQRTASGDLGGLGKRSAREYDDPTTDEDSDDIRYVPPTTFIGHVEEAAHALMGTESRAYTAARKRRDINDDLRKGNVDADVDPSGASGLGATAGTIDTQREYERRISNIIDGRRAEYKRITAAYASEPPSLQQLAL